MANRQLKRSQDYWCAQIQGTRNYQEDDIGFDDSHPDILLLLLADGMGGYAGGDTASQKVIEVFANTFYDDNHGNTAKQLEYSLNQANNALSVIKKKKPELKRMGCTFVGAALNLNSALLHWVSVGDSPLWAFINGTLIRLNEDHSKRAFLDELVKHNKITVKEAAESPYRNVLTSALTGNPPSLLDSNSIAVANNNILLLATDGLFSLSNKEIEQQIRRDIDLSAEEIVNKLLDAINHKNIINQDNTSVLVVKTPKNFKKS